jgi:uncharacterized protein YcbK (DUF882 family)
MAKRREFLTRVLRLGGAGLYSGYVAGCVTRPPERAATPAVAPVAPASTAPGAQKPAPTLAEGMPNPPPDIFDASLIDGDFWQKPRTLNLYRLATREQISLLYWKDGAMVDGAYDKVCTILRDVQAGKTIRMDPKLIETLWACQAFCARYGIHHPLTVLSGYRTPATNRKLIEQGLPAARKSLHLDGQAADVRIVDLDPEVLGGLVKSFERGGVGFYFRPGGATGGWIHTDTGVNRVWRG